MNKLIIIGIIGYNFCYLNVSKKEAIERYCKTQNIPESDLEERFYDIKEIEFDDVFGVYDIWEV